MSDNVTSFIPTNPTVRVSDADTKVVERFLTTRYAGCTEIQIARTYEKPFFIDAGENHEAIRCPTCGGDIPVGEWQEAMKACWVEASQGFDLAASRFSCCGASHSLNQLLYVPHQGFAMVSFEVTNPPVQDHIPTLEFLTGLLSVEFAVVNARY